jgi:peptide/nickel transport system substrate-binding protein
VAPTSNVRFRSLLQRAIDRGSLVAAATRDEATAQHVPVPQAHWAYFDTPLDQPEREEVRQEFRDLGYPLGLRLRLIADERNVAFSNAAVFLQEQLAFVGIALRVDLLDPGDMRDALANGEYDLLATNLDAWQDPHELFRPLVRSDGVRNVNGYASAQCDRLIDAAILIDSEERRGSLYRQVQEVLLREVPFVVLYLQRYFDGMTSLLESYPQYPPVRGLAMRHCLLDPAGSS